MTAKIARARRAITAAETALASLDACADGAEIVCARLAAEAALAEAGATLRAPTFGERVGRVMLISLLVIFGLFFALLILGSV